MEENYFFENTNFQNFTAKPNTISSIKLKNNKKSFIVFLSLFLMLFLGNEMNGQTTYNATAGAGNWSFTVPCDVTSINVQAWGPGGKGGDATTKNKYGSGGGGGGYTTSILSVTSGQVINLTVGAGNSLTNTTILTLTAGYGTSGGADSGPVGLGGTSSGGTPNSSGSPGLIGTSSSSGAGGNCPSGGIGGTGSNINSNGNPGGIPGGGGAGGYRNSDGGSGLNGGNGGDGQVIITYTSAFKAYCSPSFTGRVEPITNVTFAGINNTTSATVDGTPANERFCIAANLVQGSSTNSISVRGNTAGSFTNHFRVFIDWNQNGIFENNPTEAYYLGTIANSGGNTITLISNISVPATALTGNTHMRVIKNYNSDPTNPCGTYTFGQSEDYAVNVAAPSPCVAPTAQPTALSLGTTTTTTIPGSFTLASPTANNYLVVINTSGIAPAPVNGTTYTIGSTVMGGSNIVVDTDGNSTFTATGLLGATTYYFYVFSYNSLCSGGPKYFTTSPLIGNTMTLNPNYCTTATSSSTTRYINSFQTVGNLTNMSNLNTGYTNSGYSDYTNLPTTSQIPGGGITAKYTLNDSQSLKAWVDWNKDGTFDDTTERIYDTGGYLGTSTSFGFVVPLLTNPGKYRMRIRCYFSGISAITSCGLLSNGETEDYSITIIQDCTSKITNVNDNKRCETGQVSLTATATADTTEFRWYTAATGGSLVGTSPTGTWNTPSISSTTIYWVAAWNGSCESFFREKVIATVNASSIINFNPLTPIVCGENSVVSVNALGDTEVIDLINENFEGAAKFTTTKNGGTTYLWETKTSTFIPTATALWRPAINSRSAANKFAYINSNSPGEVVNTQLISSTVSTSLFSDLTLTFRHYFSYYTSPGDHGYVQISTDGGTIWTNLYHYQSDQGEAGQFETVTLSLPGYLNKPNLKIRFSYESTGGNGWAIDDIRLYGTKPVNTAFTWTSDTPVRAYTDAALTIPYTNQAVTTVYIKPTDAQMAIGTWSFTATATLSNGCTVSKPITVTNNTKTWIGSTLTDWNTASNWLPAGIPTASTCVIIPTAKTSKIINTPDAVAKTVTIKAPTGNLELQSDKNLTVTDNIIVESGATFNIKNNANLVQINNVANTGIVTIERITQAMNRYDFTYWSSPLTAASNFTLGDLSPFTLSDKYFSWTPSIGGLSGNWKYESTATKMEPGIGYIVRAPQTFNISGTKSLQTANFIGTPNNGDVTVPITYGTMGPVADFTDDKWNLLGNPYPSAINAVTFLDNTTNAALLDGTIYFWTHNTIPLITTPDPFYGDFVYNYTDEDYAAWNRTGGVATAAAISGGVTPNGFIASGQSFLTLSLATAPSGNNAIFKNDMRRNISTGVTYANNQFFKQANNNKTNKNTEIKTEASEEKHRIWLNLTNNSGAFSQILVGYVPGATQDRDRSYDGELIGGNDVTFYSIIPETHLTIQGRALPFDQNDQVNLGYNAAIAASLSIRIDHIDGLFDTQNIYLEDKKLDIIHDLKKAPYVFTTEIGDFDNRFVLRYTNKDKTLGTTSVETINDVLVTVNQKVTVQSPKELIKNIVVYDLLGRKIDSYEKVNALQFTLNHLNKTTVGLILKITLDDDRVISKKIIY